MWLLSLILFTLNSQWASRSCWNAADAARLGPVTHELIRTTLNCFSAGYTCSWTGSSQWTRRKVNLFQQSDSKSYYLHTESAIFQIFIFIDVDNCGLQLIKNQNPEHLMFILTDVACVPPPAALNNDLRFKENSLWHFWIGKKIMNTRDKKHF